MQTQHISEYKKETKSARKGECLVNSIQTPVQVAECLKLRGQFSDLRKNLENLENPCIPSNNICLQSNLRERNPNIVHLMHLMHLFNYA